LLVITETETNETSEIITSDTTSITSSTSTSFQTLKQTVPALTTFKQTPPTVSTTAQKNVIEYSPDPQASPNTEAENSDYTASGDVEEA